MQNLQKILIYGSVILIILIAVSLFYFYNPALFQSLIRLKFLASDSAQNFSPLALFFILAFSTLISEDLACLAAGTFAAQDKINLALAVLACFLGIFIGSILLFLIGRLGGTSVLKLKIVKKFISEKTIEQAKKFLDKYGIWAVFLSRFTPGLRLPIYVLAGILQTSFLKFTLFFFIAAAVWTPILVGGSAWLGEEFFDTQFFENNFWIGLIIFVTVIFLIIKIGLKLINWRKPPEKSLEKETF